MATQFVEVDFGEDDGDSSDGSTRPEQVRGFMERCWVSTSDGVVFGAFTVTDRSACQGIRWAAVCSA